MTYTMDKLRAEVNIILSKMSAAGFKYVSDNCEDWTDEEVDDFHANYAPHYIYDYNEDDYDTSPAGPWY